MKVFDMRKLVTMGNNLNIKNNVIKNKQYFSINYIENIYIIILLL